MLQHDPNRSQSDHSEACLRMRKSIVLTWASFSSLIGMPMVEVSFPMLPVASGVAVVYQRFWTFRYRERGLLT